jgi:hypothetical protein
VRQPAANAAQAKEAAKKAQQTALDILADPPAGLLPESRRVVEARAADGVSPWPVLAAKLEMDAEAARRRWRQARRAAGLLGPPERRPPPSRVTRPSGLYASCEGYSPSAGVADWRAAS